ncbi:MAG: hypothetical protein L0I93_07965 [Atopostipes suicloacalis]|nr:hypothetical protein [Atopostipes suicloacalis]MDN6317948.1 hypothetical protein [Lactococcus lactis]
MCILTKRKLLRMEDHYYWTGNKDWVPFTDELKNKLLDVYGDESYPYEWSEQDIYQGLNNIITDYFSKQH